MIARARASASPAAVVTLVVTVLAVVLAVLALGGLSVRQAAAQQTPQTGGDPAPAPPPEVDALEVTLIDVDGEPTGTVVLTEGADEAGEPTGTLTVEASVQGLTPGFAGFHIHESGVCEPDAPDGPFATAGGHYVGGGGEHPDHDGDLPVLLVRGDGAADLTAVTDRFTLDELRAEGTALIVHSDPDNYANIPERYLSTEFDVRGPDPITLSAGDSGSRVACGVIAPDGPGVTEGAGLVTVQSDVSFDTTVERIRTELESLEDAGFSVVAVVDHAAAADSVGLELPHTTLFVFGNPQAGTPLIQAARSVGIDLPQKLLVWEDGDTVYVTYNDPAYLAARHGIEGQDERLDAIAATLRRLATGEGG